ncbi:MAG: hypothetical protein HC895_03040 [Leptolyngbyaceae cyanobacterium SM1_3_5]|nr:hypothetical protein [Leptolyngbyaceae cyanobacterium SM1_3_5]
MSQSKQSPQSQFQVNPIDPQAIEIVVQEIRIRLRVREMGSSIDADYPDTEVIGVNPTTQVATRFHAPTYAAFFPLVLPDQADAERKSELQPE